MDRRHGVRMDRMSVGNEHPRVVSASGETGYPHNKFGTAYSLWVPMQLLFFSPSLATPTASGDAVARVVRHWYSPRGVERGVLGSVPWW